MYCIMKQVKYSLVYQLAKHSENILLVKIKVWNINSVCDIGQSNKYKDQWL